MDEWDIPMYASTVAGRLTGLRPERVRRWLKGYDYSYRSGPSKTIRKAHKEPVIIRNEAADSLYASFLDLIDLLFAKRFLDHGISLQKLRKALREAEELTESHHFAQRSFFTDGQNIYMEFKDKSDALMELLSGRQWVIASVIKELAHQIEFDEPSGFARRWYPLGHDGLVVLDPKISFGQPTLMGHGICTANVYDFYLGEDRNIRSVSSWMNLKEREIEAAIAFEQKLAAA